MMYLLKIGSVVMMAALVILLNSGFSAQASMLDSNTMPPKKVLVEDDPVEYQKAKERSMRMNIMDRPMRDRAP